MLEVCVYGVLMFAGGVAAGLSLAAGDVQRLLWIVPGVLLISVLLLIGLEKS